MKAIQDIRRYLSTHSDTPSAEVLSRLPDTLSKEETLALRDLYALDWESFELAIELLRDWRLDRYYMQRPEPGVTAPAEVGQRTALESLEAAE